MLQYQAPRISETYNKNNLLMLEQVGREKLAETSSGFLSFGWEVACVTLAHI